jgi:hypothetical protein
MQYLILLLLVALLIWVGFLSFRFSKLQRQIFTLTSGAEEVDVLEAVSEHVRKVEEASRRQDRIIREQQRISERLGRTLQNVGLVRYNAFDDIGGELSFSLSLLSDEGDGIVLSNIRGRNESMVYAKGIERGRSKIALSEEEQEAINRVMGESQKNDLQREGYGPSKAH